jgi:hypothetical protein
MKHKEFTPEEIESLADGCERMAIEIHRLRDSQDELAIALKRMIEVYLNGQVYKSEYCHGVYRRAVAALAKAETKPVIVRAEANPGNELIGEQPPF